MIQHSKSKDIIKYISHIQDTNVEIKNLKINNIELFVIQALNNLITYFWPYLTICNWDSQEKKELPCLNKLIKSFEDEQMRLLNKNRETAN